jgi:hypothetical protein
MTQIKEAISSLRCVRIVTEGRGSWKWQDAYRQNTYGAKIRQRDGMAIWESRLVGRKYSEPQLRGIGAWATTDHGSVHHQPITRDEAVEQLGGRAVQRLEGNHGVRFDESSADDPCKVESVEQFYVDIFGSRQVDLVGDEA